MAKKENERYKDTSLSAEERAEDLVSRMTLAEKVSQMIHGAAAIEKLGIPEYNWWNECLHGVARAGVATVFPQAIGMAASWNTDLLGRVADVISTEARAKHHDFARRGDRGIYKGLTYWSPNINIFRDPRWGRGHETYGEDPYLTARMGVAFVKGLQGDDPKYLKLVATPKHYAVHSGPEKDRHHFDAKASEKDMRETYLPAFKATVQEAKAESIMGAYNRTNGEACCASPTLLQKILRDEWGFKGYVVSDCGAIRDIHEHHKLVKTEEEAPALAVRAGCDLNCGMYFPHLVRAVRKKLISEKEIDVALRRLFVARFKLGMFDPDEDVPYAQIPIEVNACEEHRALGLEMARESMVLLKNEDGFLPLSKDLKTIAVIGPNADDTRVLKGNYYGDAKSVVTPLAGIQNKLPEARVMSARGCEHVEPSEEGFAQAAEVAKKADVAIICLGLSNEIEGEQGEGRKTYYAEVGDRREIDLPIVQQRLLEAVYATGTPVVLVLLNGSAVAVNWAQKNVKGILEAWYPGEAGGTAVADVLFGDYNPGGRLPVTFNKSLDQLPPFEDYNMDNRTYRFFKGEPLYPFGFGLSYTKFKYANLRTGKTKVSLGESADVSVEVENVGRRAGDEVAQLYVTDDEASTRVPVRQLAGFRRIHFEPGEKATVKFTITPEQLSVVDEKGKQRQEPGTFTLSVGGCQPGYEALTGDTTGVVTAKLEVAK